MLIESCPTSSHRYDDDDGDDSLTGQSFDVPIDTERVVYHQRKTHWVRTDRQTDMSLSQNIFKDSFL